MRCKQDIRRLLDMGWPRMQPHRWLRKQRVVLSDDQVEQVYAAARLSTTWPPAR